MADQVVIDDEDEVLNRQVPPGLYDNKSGEPMWTAFGPQTSDAGLMSTLRGHVDPAEAYRRHTEDHNLRSTGTWGVRVGDATAQDLPAIDDGGSDGIPQDHASVDFRKLSRAEKTSARRRLHEIACAQGPLYAPTSPPADPEL